MSAVLCNKRHIRAFIFVARGEHDVTVDVSAEVFSEEGRITVKEVESSIPLTSAEVDEACASLADHFRCY